MTLGLVEHCNFMRADTYIIKQSLQVIDIKLSKNITIATIKSDRIGG
jgi:hypothetical protein